MHTIKFPSFLTIRYANGIILKCEEAILSSDDEVLFDFSLCRWMEPFAITLIVGAMRQCQARNHDVKYVSSSNSKLEEHLKRIGFYDWGMSTGVHSRYAGRQVELRHLNTLDPLYTDEIIGVLQSYLTLSQGVRQSLHLSLNELMTNAFDHSRSVAGCFVCGQAYTNRGHVSICLTDFGRGILSSLSSSPNYQSLSNSIEAIELAIKEGVSSRVDMRAGLGLTHIHRFLEINKGKIDIISGDGWVHWDYEGGGEPVIVRKRLGIEFGGTVVNINARADGEGLYFLSSENPEDDIF